MTASPTAHRVLLIAVIGGSLLLGTRDAFSQRKTGNMLGHLRPRHSREIASSPWGIQAGTLDTAVLGKGAAIGVKWTRLAASWREIEKERGIYSWQATDRAFAAAIQQGITPFVCLSVSNRLYCSEALADNSQEREIYGSNPFPPTRDPRALEAWLRFVRATVERYKTSIRFWEIWNEPNHWAYWGATPNGADYGLLVRETAAVIRTVDPGARIIGGALAGLDPEFTDSFLADGTADMIDIVSFHNYAATPEERIYKAAEVWTVIRKHRPEIQLWQGECGYPSHSSTRDYRGTSPWGIVIQAKWLLRQAFTDVFFCRTTLSNYFKLAHEGGRNQKPRRSTLAPLDSVLGFPERGGSRVKSVGVNEKCILENPGLEPKPAYFAYQNLCAVYDSRYSPRAIPTTVTIRDPGIFYGIGPEDDAFPSQPLVATFATESGAGLVAYWLPWHPQEIIREGSVMLALKGLSFKDPILIDLLSGEVYPLEQVPGPDGSATFDNIPLADFPFVIAEKSEIEVQ